MFLKHTFSYKIMCTIFCNLKVTHYEALNKIFLATKLLVNNIFSQYQSTVRPLEKNLRHG